MLVLSQFVKIRGIGFYLHFQIFLYFLSEPTVYSLQQTQVELEEEVDLLMSSDIVAAQMSINQISFSRAQSGWIFRADKEVI